MKRKLAVGVAAGALATGGAAVALGAGSDGGPFSGDPEADLAEDLAAELDGVSASEIEAALERVREERTSEMRQRAADAIAAELDGVSADQVAAAFEKHDDEVRAAIEAGELPDPGDLVETLAEELGKSEEEIEDALGAAREEAFGDAHFAPAPPPGAPGFGPEVHIAPAL
jgi:hypothetical protein